MGRSELQGALSKHVSVEILSVSEEEDAATANVVIRNVDVAEIFEGVPETVNSQEDSWRIQMTPALSDALLGGYNTLVDAAMERGVN